MRTGLNRRPTKTAPPAKRVQRCELYYLDVHKEWGLKGPVSELVVGRIVSVKTPDGLEEKRVGAVIGQPFTVNGAPWTLARVAKPGELPRTSGERRRELQEGLRAPYEDDEMVPATRENTNDLCANCGERPGTVSRIDVNHQSALCCHDCARLPADERLFS